MSLLKNTVIVSRIIKHVNCFSQKKYDYSCTYTKVYSNKFSA